MVIPVECPVCAEELNFPNKYVGKTVKCPHCLSAVRVPSDEPDEPEGTDRPRRQPRPLKRRAKPKRSSGVLIGAAVGVVLLATTVGAALLARSGKRDGSANAAQKAENEKGLSGGSVPVTPPQALVGPVRPQLPAGWVDFRHPKGEYSVYVPRRPRALTHSREGPPEDKEEGYETPLTAVDRPEVVCTVVAVTYPPELMEMYRTGNIDMSVVGKMFPGMKATSNRIEWNGRIAVEVTQESDLAGMTVGLTGGSAFGQNAANNTKLPGNVPLKQTMYMRHVVVNDRLYTFVIRNLHTLPTEAERRAFFESVVFGR